MLGVLLHAPRGPFYSPKAARSRWEQSGKAILAFCRRAHRTVRCTPDTVRCPISFLNRRSRPLPTVADLAHRTVRCTPDSPVPPSDRWLGHVSRADRAADRCPGRPLAHRTVRCTPASPVPPSDRWLGHVSRADRAADRCPGRPLAHRTVRCTPDSPVNFSRSRRRKTRERLVCAALVWRTGHCPVHTGQSGAPARSSIWLYTATLHFLSFLLLPVSNTWTRY